MMGPEYFTVGAYVVDGDILCPECGEADNPPAEKQITLAQLWESFSEGAVCGGCCEVLVEPEVDEEEIFEEESYEEEK